ncbi:MAG: hypothetical protein C0601_02455 [Candidatus Muiribacterium halophilum]|uniref:AAA domain-containing protein n=1 Tax=Muiribacterium halophilum TaxID=2053465 RepID=A0A2N5ZKI3_MUIH1|nr:MAG: hypothetical protein C0601_02455 [Candidatus Muirbacterium halophilum]
MIVFFIFTVLISMLYIILKKHATKINSYINRLKENILKKMKTKNITIKKVKKIEDPDIIAKISKVKNTEPYDITLIDREGPYNTVFKKIAETIRNSTGSFIITPFKDGAGSTFLAVNLSNIFAREGERVLIIDSNFQEPMLHRIYSVENEKGFSDVLEGKDPKELIQKTDNRLIDVLSSGLNPLGVGELFENTLFLEFISEMEKEYSRIIIDMPSIDKSELPYIAGKFVPYIVVVNKEEHVEVCRSNAESKNNVFLGCILNKN